MSCLALRFGSVPNELAGVESMVGLFINTLPVRIQFSANDLLIPSLQKWQAQQIEREQYAYTPLLDIQRWSEVPNGIPLFDSIVFFDNYPIDSTLTRDKQLFENRSSTSTR